MLDPLNARAVLQSYGLKPQKRLGQNFIIRHAAIEQVLRAADLGDEEQILEIGAGLGALTLELARQGHSVHAVEFDPRLIPILADMLGAFQKVNIIHADFLQLDLGAILIPKEYIVVANIPYQITSAVIRKLVEAPTPACRLVLTIQKEVAERIIARPGNLSLLGLSVQLFGHPQILSHISSKSFFPEPKVESSVVKIEMFREPEIPVADIDRFFRIAKAGFSQKRKKLRNALAAGLHLSPALVEQLMREVDIPPNLRAQELDIAQWQRLSIAFNSVSDRWGD